jgi:hypothetical protein
VILRSHISPHEPTTVDPFYRVDMPKCPRQFPVWLEREEQTRLNTITATPEALPPNLCGNARDRIAFARQRYAVLFALLQNAGLRISEALALKVSDVRVVGGQARAVRVIGKGDKGRVVPLPVSSYGPLRLRLEVRIEPETNSGVFVGCTPGEAISPTVCYEINLWDRHPKQEWRTGALVGISPPLNHVDTLGRWNRLEILVEEKRLRVWINDTLTADRMTEAPRTGHLALQFGGSGAVHFRWLTLEQP